MPTYQRTTPDAATGAIAGYRCPAPKRPQAKAAGDETGETKVVDIDHRGLSVVLPSAKISDFATPSHERIVILLQALGRGPRLG